MRHTRHRDPRPALMLIGAVILFTPLLSGCQKTLFSPREGRSQFDNYDMSRGQHPPQYVEDEFGRRTPNLRGRLGERQ